MSYDVMSLRKKIPELSVSTLGEKLIYLDNAASSLMHEKVIQRVEAYHRRESSNVHRGAHELSQRATESYENARLQVQRFLGVHTENPPQESVVFTRGTTEGINVVAYSWALQNLVEGDEILITQCEHHSNLVPWQFVAEKTGAKICYVPLNRGRAFVVDDFIKKMTEKTRLVSTFWYSNSLGWGNPIAELGKECLEREVRFCVDGAQAPLHHEMNLSDINLDFLAFSGHKMMAPHGVGALYVRPGLVSEMTPFQFGGSMIDRVSFEKTTYANFPQIFEAGTPNVGGAIGLGEACEIISDSSRSDWKDHISKLRIQLVEGLSDLNCFKLFEFEAEEKGSVVSFTHLEAHPSDVADLLNQYGVAVRSGHHCTQPLMEVLGVPGTVRISLAPYTTEQEISKTLNYLQKVKEFL